MPFGERHPPAPRGEHLHWLDWVRFLAAAVVVYGHVCGFQWDAFPDRTSAARPLALEVFLSARETGRQAVVVFFVLSGLLVGGKVAARWRAGTFDAPAYAADRLSRVYVPLVPAVLLMVALLPFSDQPWNPWPSLQCLTGTQQVFAHTPSFNAPLWTLAYEIWFYVLAGCAVVAFRRESAPWQRLAAGTGVAAAGWLFWKMETAYLLCWLLGAAGFWLRDRVRPARGLCAAAGGFVMLAGTVMYQIDLGILPSSPGVWLPPPHAVQVIVAAGSLLLIAGLMGLAPAAPALQRTERLGTLLAASSYTLYLTHYPIVYLLALHVGRVPPALTWYAAARGALWIAACALVAWVMYAVFEARTPSVRRWLRARFGAVTRNAG